VNHRKYVMNVDFHVKTESYCESLSHLTRQHVDDLASPLFPLWREQDTVPQTQGEGGRAVADTEETPLSRGQEVTPACEKALVLWNALHWCERHTRIHMATQLNAKKAFTTESQVKKKR